MLEKSAIDERVQDAYAADGYLHDNGTKDRQALRQRLVEVLAENPVPNKKERTTKAVTEASMVAGVFPSFPDPEAWDDEHRELLEVAYRTLRSRLWAETSSDANSALQQMVGEHMGNGFVVCRTKVGKDRLNAAYISDDRGCCEADFLTPLTAKADRLVGKISASAQLLIKRQPGNAGYYGRQVKSTFAAIEGRMKADMTKAIEASKNIEDGGDDGEADDGE